LSCRNDLAHNMHRQEFNPLAKIDFNLDNVNDRIYSTTSLNLQFTIDLEQKIHNFLEDYRQFKLHIL